MTQKLKKSSVYRGKLEKVMTMGADPEPHPLLRLDVQVILPAIFFDTRRLLNCASPPIGICGVQSCSALLIRGMVAVVCFSSVIRWPKIPCPICTSP
jgi:hypothetical protein